MCLPTSEEQQQQQQLGANTESLLSSIRAPLAGKSKRRSLGPRARGGVEDGEPEGGLLSDLREVQCLICCLLHQMFIADPNIAKLVHFQVTQREDDEVDCTRDLFCFAVTVRRLAGLQSPKHKREGYSRKDQGYREITQHLK